METQAAPRGPGGHFWSAILVVPADSAAKPKMVKYKLISIDLNLLMCLYVVHLLHTQSSCVCVPAETSCFAYVDSLPVYIRNDSRGKHGQIVKLSSTALVDCGICIVIRSSLDQYPSKTDGGGDNLAAGRQVKVRMYCDNGTHLLKYVCV